jgi:hypothetical protein
METVMDNRIIWSTDGMILTGDARTALGKKKLFNAILSTKNALWNGLRLSPVLVSDMPCDICLVVAKARWVAYVSAT